MNLDLTHPLNQTLIQRHQAQGYKGAPVVDPEAHPDPYMGAGSHPDVVARVWDELGEQWGVHARAMIYGSPGLLHPKGVVMALAWGTAYALRVPEVRLKDAMSKGCALSRTWSDKSVTDIVKECGEGWVFGGWGEDERQWLQEVWKDLVTSRP